MLLKIIFATGLALLLLAAGWRARNSSFVRELVHPSDTRPPDIRFDNGTVRTYEPASAPAGAPPIPIGTMRKCVRGATVQYTDRPCPAGAREQPVGGSVSILPAPDKPVPPAKKLPHARDLLVPPEDESLRDKRMDRTIGR